MAHLRDDSQYTEALREMKAARSALRHLDRQGQDSIVHLRSSSLSGNETFGGGVSWSTLALRSNAKRVSSLRRRPPNYIAQELAEFFEWQEKRTSARLRLTRAQSNHEAQRRGALTRLRTSTARGQLATLPAELLVGIAETMCRERRAPPGVTPPMLGCVSSLRDYARFSSSTCKAIRTALLPHRIEHVHAIADADYSGYEVKNRAYRLFGIHESFAPPWADFKKLAGTLMRDDWAGRRGLSERADDVFISGVQLREKQNIATTLLRRARFDSTLQISRIVAAIEKQQDALREFQTVVCTLQEHLGSLGLLELPGAEDLRGPPIINEEDSFGKWAALAFKYSHRRRTYVLPPRSIE